MGSQSLLSLGALLLLSMLSLQLNSSVLVNRTTEIEDKIYLTAFSLADDLVEEIKEKAFDEKTIDFQAIAVNQLTSADMLTFESGESWPNFDDIDDYNGYQIEIDLPHAEGYNLTCKVNYVDSDGNDLTTQSYYKKATITVSSKYLNHPFYMSFIFSLHSKN
jgi:hypothetical protein